MMYVFTYGSLMWDGWEEAFGCTSKEVATLAGYRRDFSKASIRNWGTPQNPAPTLGLCASQNSECVGMVFEFPELQRDRVWRELSYREAGFALEEKQVVLASGSRAAAVVAVNDPTTDSFIGDRPLEDRARQARTARGTLGSGLKYVEGISARLRELGIRDPAVEEFARLVSRVRIEG